ncbi:MAG: hypothetical protein HKP14_09685 [Bacteroidia bacterium]|nr:hypothetical protein [Bacteroidia bacterium]
MLTAQDIIKDLKYYALSVWQKKIIIFIISAIVAIGWSYKLLKRPPLYVAEKTFMVSDDEGGGGISSILGQFGLGGSGGGGSYNYKKIMEIGQSNLIIDQVLFDSASILGKNDLVANRIIELYDLHENWNKDTILNNFLFTKDNRNSRKGKLARKILQGKIKGNPKEPSSKKLVRFDYSEESTILKISGEAQFEELSILLAESTYEKLSRFYINKSIERQATTYKQLKSKADSIYRLLSGSESSFAKSSNFNMGLVLPSDNISSARSMRNIEMYSTMYGEVLKNKETADFMLKSQTPFFQTIDSPFAPLGNSNTFSIINAILAFISGVILTSIVVILMAYYRKEIKPLITETE